MKRSEINRRKFLSKASAGIAGVGAGVFTGSGIESYRYKNGTEVPKVKEYRTLGRTGFKVSDIECGPAVMTNENLLKAVIDSGVNIIDTAEFYSNGNNEILGRYEKGTKREPTYLRLHKKRYELIIEKQKKAEQFLNDNPRFNKGTRIEAAVGFCLDNPAVSSVLISFRTFEDINDYVVLSGNKLTSENISIINALKENCGFLYCRHACGKCEPSCPFKVPVNTIMRYNHYFTAQAREKYSIQQYSLLAGANAGSCSSCAGYCEEACPYGVHVKTLLTLAHLNLSVDKS